MDTMTSYFIKIGVPVEILEEMNEMSKVQEQDDETFHTEGEF